MSTRSCPYAQGHKLDAYSHVGPGRRGTYVHTYLARQRCRRGCKATATPAAPAAPAAPMLLLFAKRCIILSAMLGISKRNTSGFAIVLRICSPIQRPPSLSGSFRLSLSPRHPLPLLRSVPLSLCRSHRWVCTASWLSPTRAASQLIPTLHATGVHDLQITRKPSLPNAMSSGAIIISAVCDRHDSSARLPLLLHNALNAPRGCREFWQPDNTVFGR